MKDTNGKCGSIHHPVCLPWICPEDGREPQSAMPELSSISLSSALSPHTSIQSFLPPKPLRWAAEDEPGDKGELLQ